VNKNNKKMLLSFKSCSNDNSKRR